MQRLGYILCLSTIRHSRNATRQSLFIFQHNDKHVQIHNKSESPNRYPYFGTQTTLSTETHSSRSPVLPILMAQSIHAHTNRLQAMHRHAAVIQISVWLVKQSGRDQPARNISTETDRCPRYIEDPASVRLVVALFPQSIALRTDIRASCDRCPIRWLNGDILKCFHFDQI